VALYKSYDTEIRKRTYLVMKSLVVTVNSCIQLNKVRQTRDRVM